MALLRRERALALGSGLVVAARLGLVGAQLEGFDADLLLLQEYSPA